MIHTVYVSVRLVLKYCGIIFWYSYFGYNIRIKYNYDSIVLLVGKYVIRVLIKSFCISATCSSVTIL